MDPFALLLLIAAAIAHAGWNMFAKKAGAGGAPFVFCVTVAATLIYAPLVAGYLLSAKPKLTGLLLGAIAVSTVLRLLYLLVLQRGYAVGDLTVVYPLAHGTGPLLAVVFAAVLLGERPPPLVLLGGSLVVVGVLVVGSAGIRARVKAAAETTAVPAPAKRRRPALLLPALRLRWKENGSGKLVCSWERVPTAIGPAVQSSVPAVEPSTAVSGVPAGASTGGGTVVLERTMAATPVRLDKRLVLTSKSSLEKALGARVNGAEHDGVKVTLTKVDHNPGIDLEPGDVPWQQPKQRRRWMSKHPVRAGAGYGLLTGGVIAGYTLWDATAVTTLAVAPLLLEWGCNLGRSVILAPYAAVRFKRVRQIWREHRREVLAVGVLSPLSYILILLALTRAPVSVVAPARELSIVVAGLFGWLLLRESNPLIKLAGACVVLGGVVTLAMS